MMAVQSAVDRRNGAATRILAMASGPIIYQNEERHADTVADILAYLLSWQRVYGVACDYFALCSDFADYTRSYVDHVLTNLERDMLIVRPAACFPGPADIQLAMS